jgi:hypothetical protein
MKKIIIPLFKTSCGERVSGDFYIENKIVMLYLIPQGSQLLDYTISLMQKIINNKDFKYTVYADKIFWRLNTLNIQGSRKRMVEEVVEYIQSSIEITLSEKIAHPLQAQLALR